MTGAGQLLDLELADLESGIAENRRNIKRKKRLDKEIPKLEEEMRRMEEEAGRTELLLTRMDTERKLWKEQRDDLAEILGGQTREEAEEKAGGLREKLHFLQKEREKAEQNFRRCREELTALQAAVQALEAQQSEEPLAAEEILERKQQWTEEKARLSGKRAERYAAGKKNRDIYEAVCDRQQMMIAVEQEYVWVKALSDTANGTLTGKRKIELETFIQKT